MTDPGSETRFMTDPGSETRFMTDPGSETRFGWDRWDRWGPAPKGAGMHNTSQITIAGAILNE